MPLYHNACDIVALTPPRDGTDSFPNTLLEAMSCGNPVIGTKMGGIPEMLNDKVGFLVEHGDVESLKAALKKLIYDEKLRTKAKGILDAYAFTANIVSLPEMKIQGLVRLLTSNGNTVLIADTGHPLLQQQGLDRCLETLPCPLLVVR